MPSWPSMRLLSGRMQSDQFPTGWALYFLHGQYWVSLRGYIWLFLHWSRFLLFPGTDTKTKVTFRMASGPQGMHHNVTKKTAFIWKSSTYPSGSSFGSWHPHSWLYRRRTWTSCWADSPPDRANGTAGWEAAWGWQTSDTPQCLLDRRPASGMKWLQRAKKEQKIKGVFERFTPLGVWEHQLSSDCRKQENGIKPLNLTVLCFNFSLPKVNKWFYSEMTLMRRNCTDWVRSQRLVIKSLSFSRLCFT